jgi:hypothetical protein
MLKKPMALKVINALLFICFALQIGSGLFRMKISPEFFEWAHERNGILLLILAVNHLILNWNWMKTSYFKKPA